jgi:hypothetical protein
MYKMNVRHTLTLYTKFLGPCKPKTCNGGSDSGSDTDDSSDSDNSHIGYAMCGKHSCVGGCHGGGCGGGCGLKGCGGCDKPDGCAAWPPKQCIPGCKTRCQAPLPPPGGPTSKPSCDEEDKQTITNCFVSCTKYNVTTVSPPSMTEDCSTTFSRTLSGCGLTATTTTTTKGDDGPACTRAPLSLDDDEGNNNPDDHNSETNQPHKPTTQPPPTSTPGPGACGGQDGCGCCYDWYNNCAYGCKGGLECRDKCLSDLCFSNDTPDKCHVNNKCAALSCPSKAGDPPKFIESDYVFYLHQVLMPHHGNVWSNKMWYQVGIPLPLGEHPTSIKLCGTGTPDDMAEINAPNMPYGVVVDHPSGSGGSGKEYVDMTFTLGVLSMAALANFLGLWGRVPLAVRIPKSTCAVAQTRLGMDVEIPRASDGTARLEEDLSGASRVTIIPFTGQLRISLIRRLTLLSS